MADATISDYIESYRNLDVSYDKLYYQELDTFRNGERVIMLSDSILSKYKDDLESTSITKILDSKEENRYFYNPQLLSYDLYGSTQYWHLLLELNNMYSAIEFNQNPIKVYSGRFVDMINSILALEEESININSEKITKSIFETSDGML